MSSAHDLRCHLAFFCSAEHEPACWLTIVSHGSSPHDCASRLLGLHYEKLYLPLMLKCGLKHIAKSNRHKSVTTNPSIESTVTNSYYTWADFIIEHKLNMEISYIILNKKKLFIRCGSFEEGSSHFTIWDQIQANMKFKYNTLRDHQKELTSLLGKESILLVASPIICPTASKTNTSSDSVEVSSSNHEIPLCIDTLNNVKNVINVHFFEKIMKPGVDLDKIWLMIGERKILSGMNELISEVHKTMHDIQTTRLLQVDKSAEVERIQVTFQNIHPFKDLASPW